MERSEHTLRMCFYAQDCQTFLSSGTQLKTSNMSMIRLVARLRFSRPAKNGPLLVAVETDVRCVCVFVSGAQ
jgi:hypothetical protein